MNSFSEDEKFLSFIGKFIKNVEELESTLLSVDKKNQLEKQSAELHEQYMMFKIELDRIRIRETPYNKILVDFLRKDLGYGPLKIKDYWHDWNQEILECHQDTELIDRGGFVNRYFQLIPPYVKSGTIIPEGIKNIYHESRWFSFMVSIVQQLQCAEQL